MLDRKFDTATLAGLREAVLGYATACGMPEHRAIDVMLAVHELAANAVRHGPGHGQLRIHVTASTLRCEVSDPGPSSRDGRARDTGGTGGTGGTGDTGGEASGAAPWPVEQGHGLWLVYAAADHVHVTSGPHGSLVTVVFALPATAAPDLQAAGLASAPPADPQHRTAPISHPEHPATGLGWEGARPS